MPRWELSFRKAEWKSEMFTGTYEEAWKEAARIEQTPGYLPEGFELEAVYGPFPDDPPAEEIDDTEEPPQEPEPVPVDIFEEIWSDYA